MTEWNSTPYNILNLDEHCMHSFKSRYLMNQFAREAFEFFVQNIHVWIEYPEDFLIQLTHLESPTVFTEDVGKAIMTFAYIFRSEYKKQFRRLLRGFTEEFGFFKMILFYPVNDKQPFFYKFMAWVSFVFSATMFMYQEGEDFIQLSRAVLANFPNHRCFQYAGDWEVFNEFAGIMSTLYDRFAAVLRKEVHNEVEISHFLKYMKKTERRSRYSQNKWILKKPKMFYADEIRRKTSAKFDIVLPLDPQRVFPGYIAVQKTALRNLKESSKKLATESSDVDSVEHDHQTVDILMHSRTETCSVSDEHAYSKSPRLVTRDSSRASTSSVVGDVTTEVAESTQPSVEKMKSVFVISGELLAKRATIEHERPGCKEVIKIYSPTKKTDIVSENLLNMLDKNIEKEGYSEIRDGVWEVNSHGCLDDADSRIIVLDTSSEEDDVNEEEDFLDELKALVKAIRKEYSAATKSESQVEKLIKTGTKRPISAESSPSSDGVQPAFPEKGNIVKKLFHSQQFSFKQSIMGHMVGQVSGLKQNVPTSSTGEISTTYKSSEKRCVEIAGDLSVENRSEKFESMDPDTDTEEENIQYPSPTKKIRQGP